MLILEIVGMNQNKIFVVGLTGNIGSGKSTVSNILREKEIPIIDADLISREVLIKHPKLLKDIMDSFGNEYFDSNGNLLRKKLGNLIFSNNEKKIQLENMLLPFIIRDIFDKIEEYDKKGFEFCIVDAPTLIENNLHFYMDAVILVTVERDVQIQRVATRDSLNLEDVMKRINSQISQDEKIKMANFIIDNNKSLYNTKIQVEQILNEMKILRGKNVN
jgi:dephospho-CoA kinase